MGGKEILVVGFVMGLECLVLMMEILELIEVCCSVDVYMVSVGDGIMMVGMKFVE